MRDPLVWSSDDPECFDFDTLLPDALPGGQSIYGGYFDVSFPPPLTASPTHKSSLTRPPRAFQVLLDSPPTQHPAQHKLIFPLLTPCRPGLALDSPIQHRIARWELESSRRLSPRRASRAMPTYVPTTHHTWRTTSRSLQCTYCVEPGLPPSLRQTPGDQQKSHHS